MTGTLRAGRVTMSFPLAVNRRPWVSRVVVRVEGCAGASVGSGLALGVGLEEGDEGEERGDGEMGELMLAPPWLAWGTWRPAECMARTRRDRRDMVMNSLDRG